MDIRQLAPLASQPAAAEKNRELFLGMPKRGLAFLLANVMFWQPMWAQADGIVVANPNTSLDRAGNGVPIINIATPNASGLSHNQFHDYNVGAQGLILNNGSTQNNLTQLGGHIIDNPNLKNSGSAQAILNEVISGNPSQLRGYTEVAGQSARVIVANPYGITCNGCGFINSPRVTLTTGKPVLDNGRLDRFQVDQGSVAIEGAGLNATNVDRFEIITRSAKINAEIQAQSLTIVAGRNDVNAQTLNATARADDGSSKPQLAIDSSALGGMYAGAIKLVGTEAGVGVKLDGKLIASGGDIQLDANGQLSLAETSATGAVNVKAASLDTQSAIYAGTALNVQTQGNLTNRQTLAARDSISLSAGGRLTNAGTIEAGVNADGSRNASGDLSLTAQHLDNAGKSLLASRNLTVNAATLNNLNGTLNAKTIAIGGGALDNRNGRMLGDLGLNIDLSAALDNRGGVLGSGAMVNLKVASLDNRDAGSLISDSGLTVRVDGLLDNRDKGALTAKGATSVSAGTLFNQAGLISGRSALQLTADQTLDNQLGTVIADGQLTLTAKSLDNRSGNLVGKSDVSVQAQNVNNQKGKLIATGVLKLNADQLDNRQNGLLGSTSAMTLTVAELDNRGGEISTNSDLLLTGKKLDNSDGGKVFASKSATLTVDQLFNRNKGLIDAATRFTLHGRTLANNGGELRSQQAMQLTVDDAFDNAQGKVSSEATLTVNAAQLINNLGIFSSAADLNLVSRGGLDNLGGKIVTDGALVIDSGSLDNRQQGTLSGKGAVTVTTGAFDNSEGLLSSADTLDLVAGQVTNNGAGSIGSQGTLTASVKGLDQQGGKLFSNTRLSLDLNHGQLNNGGSINTPGALLLKQLNGVNNQGGTISSAEAFTLTAQNLDNGSGKLLSNQGLTLRIAAALDNVKGMIGAAAIDARAGNVNNSGGSLISRGDLELNVDDQLRNDGKGLINSKGNLTLTATGLDSSNGGEVSANGDIDLTLTSLTQNGGRLLGEKSVTVDLANGDFDNQNGLLTAKGPLTFKRLRDLSNQNGEVSSNLGFDLIARAIDNSAGKIISGEKLLVRGTDLINQKGLLSGWQALAVNGNSLDNRDGGTLSSKYADVSVDLSGKLLNGGAGAVVAQGNLSINAGSLDNSDKGNLSSGAGQTLMLAGALNNNQGGLIASGAALDIVSTAFSNIDGAINAQQIINATASSLDNSGGQIASNDAITLNLSGELNNNAGKLAAAGPLLIKGVTDLHNQNGQLASQKNLDLHTGSLDNSNKGTVAANDQLLITATGAVSNQADGLIYSKNADVQMHAARLLNGRGSIQSDSGLTLEISGDFDNQSGKVIAQNGDVLITAANIDNRGGTLSSIKGALEARTVGVLRNGFDLNNNRQGGIIQAQSLTLSALAGLNNNGGRISAQAADSSITTAALTNGSGVLYAKKLLGVTGASLDNSGGQIAAERIDFSLSGALSNGAGVIESDTQLSVKAGTLDNQNGRLRSLGTTGKTAFQIAGLLDNRNGVLETANTDLTLAVGSFLNSGGQLNHVGRGKFDISTANVLGAGGSIVTGGLLELNADSWNNTSAIQAGRLNVNVREFSQSASGKLLASESLQARGGNWTNNGLIASDGSIDMQLGGTYAGSGRLSSQRGTYLSAAQMNLGAGGSFAAGATSTISVGGQLINSARISSSEDLTVNAGSVANYGSLGAAQNLFINTPTLLNDRGLIFSGNNMTLGVSTLTNQHGDFYGLGNVLIGGYGGAARAAGVYNISGSMESVKDFTLNADVFENRTEGPSASVERKLISGFIAATCGDCVGGTFNNFLATRETYQFVDSDTSASAVLNIGKDFVFQGGTFLNSKSTVAAGGNITVTADSLKNIGAKSGVIDVTRQYNFEMGTGSTAKFMAEVVMPYNQRNNPDFPSVYYVIAPQGLIRKATATTVGGGIVITDDETGENVGSRKYGRAMSGFSAGFETSTPSQYDPDNLLALPSELAQYQKGLAVETESTSAGLPGAATGRNAVIQAAGNVSINATKEVVNAVIHEDYGSTGGTNKVADTKVGNSDTVVVRINSQLPPDLAQQQVNPLSLPGFSLPTGENGLFRLSGQGSTAASGNGPAPTWTVGNEAISAQDHLAVATSGGPRNLFVDAPAQVSDSTRAVDTFHRTSSTGDDTRPVTRVTGLPDTKAPSNPHKYLIETNPVLTDLKSFMSSDYLLEKLGYNPDQSAKRLGDGLYEQRLIQQAVTARTGQAFLDGQTSNEGMFKYLMNNAIASKDALNLSVGVGLTSQQVAALTHDIVWLEEHEVNGEKVLVPVVYLAQANGRLGPTGALIAGKDVTLIAGENLDNVGTLKATNNLSATAGKDLVNSGSVEAGNRLDLLATNNIVNKAGGIIAGRDVSLTTRTGDVINERTITSMDDKYGTVTRHQDFADNAARIEAANDLTVKAANDINVIGGVLKSGQDMSLNAGRDVNVASVQINDSASLGWRGAVSSVTQLGADIDAGRDFKADAKRDFSVIASEIDAKRDVTMSATGNVLISSAADEEHSRSANKRMSRQDDEVTQVSSTVNAGGNVTLKAGKDLDLIASRVSAGNEAYLTSGANLVLQSAEDSDYSFYSKTKKSSSKKTFQLDETSSVTNVASSVTSVGKSVLSAGNDLTIKGSNVVSEKAGVGLEAGNDVEILAVTDSSSARHERSKSKSSWGGLKSSKVQDQLAETQTTAVGSLISGDTIAVNAKRDATITGSALVSTNDLSVRAGGDLTINAAQNTFTRTEVHKEKNRDLTGVLTANNLGIDDITGNQHLSISNQKHNGTMSQTTLTGSTIGSSKGNVSLIANGDLNVVASDLISTKDMSLRGSNVTIAAGMETSQQSTIDKSNSLAVGRVIGGAIIDTVNSIRSAVEAAKSADDPRLKAVKLAQAALAAYNLGGMASDANDQKTGFADKQGGTGSNGSLIKIGTELANTHSKSTSDYVSQTAKQSTVNAGGTLSIIANGGAAQNDGDLHIIGSSLKATATSLIANNNVIVESAQNTADWSNQNSNNRTAIGASFNIGQQNGFTVDLGAQVAKGMGSGSSVTQVNSTVDTDSLVIHSGGDTTLAGAQVRADTIKALIDGNLNIISRQDTETQKNNQGSGGFGASICIPPICYGAPVTASGNLAAGNMNSDYKAVTDQTGLFAGAGGYMVDVGKTTTLEGGLIASDATPDKNILITDRLITRDIKNVSEIDAQSAGISYSGGYGGAGAYGSVGGLYGISLNESDKSHTRSAVSEGTIIVRNPEGAQDLVGLNRDTENANERLDKPDEDGMKERIELVKSSIELVKGIGDAIAASKMEEAENPDSEAYKAARDKLNSSGVANPTPEEISQQVQRDYGIGSSFQKASQAVAGIVQGILSGNIAAAIGGGAAPYLAQAVKQLTEGDDAANLMAHAVLGAVLAKIQGGSALAGAAGASAGEVVARLLYPDKSADQLTESEKQIVAALSTLAGGMSGALAGGSAFDAALGAGTAKNAVENNHLSDIERLSLKELQRKYAQLCSGASSSYCDGLSSDISKLIAKGFSVLKEEQLSEDNDFTRASVVTTTPGDVIVCGTSPNGYCVATDKTITTDQGEEWVLQPATFMQAIGWQVENEVIEAAAKARLLGVSNELYTAGCGGSGVIGIGCQAYTAAGGVNLVTEEAPATTERVVSGIEGLLNVWGLGSSILGTGVKGTAGTLDRAKTGIEWGKGIQGQGMPWENYLASELPAGSRLPPNFKTFDFYDPSTGTAISAKTLDTTTAAKVGNPSQVYSSLKGNIDAVARFETYTLSNVPLDSSMITARELRVAVPGGTNSVQWVQINRAIKYGQSQGVKVIISSVK
ncbi:filamentous hemagglutinin [Pseudomonas sp. 29]|uniref:two-partner secretion domain-containing protein n=1 Tax=Pseudomonas sp. 29 TaxID=2035197 RepID=UPI000C17A1FD|nr:hemagglutinin repeat-containing protein [Pseudomonas sp. 29]PIF52660.1 filamentous hemagglutinin [Pseudomonas sp. 29]